MSKKMEQDITELDIAGYKIHLFGATSSKEELQLVYVHTLSAEEGLKLWKILYGQCVLVCIVIDKWNVDLSPWKAEKAFKQGEAFAGGAGAYLNLLITKIIPEIEKILSYKVLSDKRCIAGYSMAGLFAIFSIYHTNLFSKIVSASGSVWFDEFIKYAQKEEILVDNLQIYMSLGDKEHETKNPRMCKVKQCTQDLYSFYREKGCEIIYEVNSGGHFQSPVERLSKGIKWCLGENNLEEK